MHDAFLDQGLSSWPFRLALRERWFSMYFWGLTGSEGSRYRAHPPMKTSRLVRTLVPAVLVALLGAVPAPASAGSLKGTVRLPDGARVPRLYQGYWRLENGNVPVRPASGKAGTVVVLDGISGVHAPPPRTVTVEIAGLDAQPRVVVVGPGSVVEFKNVGKITHELSTPADLSMMPNERLNPGTFRHQKFGSPGGYLVQCSEYPHLTISVIVADSPFFALVDDKGAFQIPGNVPDGKATLKVWSMGRWVHEESIDTTGKQEITVRVPAWKNGKEPEAKEPDAKDSDPSGAEGKDPESNKGSSE
jgi:plastocyanin